MENKAKIEDEILGRIALNGKRLARRQIINENLEDGDVSAHGQYVLALFDRIVAKRGW